jgi:Zn-dependent protease
VFRRLQFGSVKGIPITASGSWLVVVFVLIWFVGQHLQDIADVSQTTSVLLGALTVLLFFLSIIAHELGHALAAMRAGLKVDGIELWMFGGFARMREAPRTPSEQLRIALAGPLVTLLVTVLLLGGIAVFHSGGLGDALEQDSTSPAVAIALLIGMLNGAVLLLNILPAYPLDGGMVARAIAWRITGDPHRATRYAAFAGMGVGITLIAGGTVLFYSDGSESSDGMALMFLGFLVAITARGSAHSARQQERLDGVTVGAIADPSVSAVDGHHTVLSATDRGGPPGTWVVVRMPGAPPRLLSAAAINEAMAKGQPAITLAELADESDDRTIAGDTSLRELIVDPRLRDGALLAIGTEGQPLGLVTSKALHLAVIAPSGAR